MGKKIELTDEQKAIIESLIWYKRLPYIATEAGCSQYKIRQYMKEVHQKCMKEIKNMFFGGE